MTTISKEALLYPACAAVRSGYVTVSQDSVYKLYYEEFGAPEGEPVFLLHGGPGVPVSADEVRFFDPQRYRIITYHQRGAGKSEPFLSLETNTTQHLADDILKLRDHLGITGKAHIFGGSWGSFLALIHAVQHPDLVASLTLRGIFLGRQRDLYNAYQRNAEVSRDQFMGAAACFPEAWLEFVSYIPPSERSDIIAAYHRRIHQAEAKGKNESLEAARRWFQWEDTTLSLEPPSAAKTKESLEDDKAVLSAAILETHYFYNKCFLRAEDGKHSDYILSNVAKIASIPTVIIQGRYDMVTPRLIADELVAAINLVRAKHGLDKISPTITTASHTMMDEANIAALIRATDGHLKKIETKKRGS